VWIVSLVVLLAFALGPAVATAEEKTEEKVDQGTLVIVEMVTVNPDGLAAYESASKKMLSVLAEHGFPYSYDAYMTDDFHYMFVYPIKSFGDIDALYGSWMKLIEAWGMDKWEAMQKEIAGAVVSSDLSVFNFRGDLSYLPEDNAFDGSKPHYIYWGTCKVKPGMEQALEKSFMDFAKLWEAKEMPFGWAAYQGFFGADMPTYVYAEWGDSPAAFWAQAEKSEEKTGDAAKGLWDQLLQTLRSYDIMTGRNRPDLSYKPAMKEKAEK
jgi:hypothetical protein